VFSSFSAELLAALLSSAAAAATVSVDSLNCDHWQQADVYSAEPTQDSLDCAQFNSMFGLINQAM